MSRAWPLRIGRVMVRSNGNNNRGVGHALWRCRGPQQYNRFVKPAFEQYIRPSIRNADVIVPRGGDNVGAQKTAAVWVG